MKDFEQPLRIAILDMNAGWDNQGMRCIRTIITEWSQEQGIALLCNEFEVRVKQEIPDDSFDIYISSGGPLSPLESIGSAWENLYFKWLNKIEKWNALHKENPKYAFFICHSFQLLCRHYEIAKLTKRHSTAFGVFPIYPTAAGKEDIIFEGLAAPFYAVDSRDYQVIEPNTKQLKEMGAAILAIEKNRPHVPYERAIMAVRFSEYFVGTQFHPEADALGMKMYLQREDKKNTVIANHGIAKWKNMIEQLADPAKISHTYARILPNFLNTAINAYSVY